MKERSDVHVQQDDFKVISTELTLAVLIWRFIFDKYSLYSLFLCSIFRACSQLNFCNYCQNLTSKFHREYVIRQDREKCLLQVLWSYGMQSGNTHLSRMPISHTRETVSIVGSCGISHIPCLSHCFLSCIKRGNTLRFIHESVFNDYQQHLGTLQSGNVHDSYTQFKQIYTNAHLCLKSVIFPLPIFLHFTSPFRIGSHFAHQTNLGSLWFGRNVLLEAVSSAIRLQKEFTIK